MVHLSEPRAKASLLGLAALALTLVVVFGRTAAPRTEGADARRADVCIVAAGAHVNELDRDAFLYPLILERKWTLSVVQDFNAGQWMCELEGRCDIVLVSASAKAKSIGTKLNRCHLSLPCCLGRGLSAGAWRVRHPRRRL